MEDKQFERFKARVHENLRNIDPRIIPASWYETVMKYYYDHGFSEERTAQTILETMKEVSEPR
jgi:hypothetical protein